LITRAATTSRLDTPAVIEIGSITLTISVGERKWEGDQSTGRLFSTASVAPWQTKPLVYLLANFAHNFLGFWIKIHIASSAFLHRLGYTRGVQLRVHTHVLLTRNVIHD